MRLLPALVTALALSACGSAPPVPEACDDFRVMTIYDDVHMPIDTNYWSDNPKTVPVCVVSEKRIRRPGAPQ